MSHHIPRPMDRPTIAYVLNRAADWRRKRYQDDDRYRHFTEAAMLEQVCGQEGGPVDLGDGWWQVGIVMDSIAGVQLDVLTNPRERKIRLREVVEPVVEKAPPLPLLPERSKLASVSSERGSNPLKWDEW